MYGQIRNFFEQKIMKKAKEKKEAKFDIPYSSLSYLVNLLAEFVEAGPNLKLINEPFAKTYLQSLNKRDYKTLKDLGDVLLFTTGLFPEYFARSLNSINYFVSIGKYSYSNVYSFTKKEIYNHLAIKFPYLKAILNDLSAEFNIKEDKGLRMMLNIEGIIH